MNIEIHQNQKTKLPESTGTVAVVYARYSSHNQTEQSIEGQLAAAHAYAEVKGYTIIHEYIDRAKTGRNDNRDDFQQMLSDCAKKQFQVIIVWKVDRFGRNREEITFNKYRAKRHGVRVEYVAENLPESPEGVILESVLEGMAEYYSLQLSQNVKRGLRENYKKGKIMGGRPPLGYRASPQKTFEIDPDTAPIVQEIFESYLNGFTCAEIRQDLNRRGIRTALGGEFNKNSIRAILSNKKYIGIYEHGPDKEVTEGAIPPLISVEIFEKVQDLMRINQKTPSKAWYKTDYLLADKIFCGCCGSPMTGESGFGRGKRRYSYYLCREHKRGGKCKAKAIRQSFIEPFIVRFTLDLLNDDELLNEVIDRTWDYYKAKSGDDSKQRALQSQINSVQASIRNLLRAVEAGFFSEATQIRMAELEAQKAALEASLAELNLNAENGLTREKIEFFLYSLRNLDYEDRDCQKRLIKIFINSIYVYEDYLILNYNYSSDSRVIRLDEIEKEDVPEAGEMVEGDTIVPENGGCFDRRASLPALTRTVETFRIKCFDRVFSVKILLRRRNK